MGQDTALEKPPEIGVIHKKHTQWRNEHADWLKDVDLWRREQELAEVMLFKLDRALPSHIATLRDHAMAIQNHERQLQTQEQLLAACLSGHGEEKQYIELMKIYRQGMEKHENMRQKHQKIQRIHSEAMKELKRITHLLEQC